MDSQAQIQKIILKLKSKKFITVTIERPRGSCQKPGWSPYPFDYGYLNILNPADQEEFDAIVLNFEKLKAGEMIKTKIVGLLLRDDLDYKLITVKPGTKVKDEQYKEIFDFYRPWFKGVKIEKWDD